MYEWWSKRVGRLILLIDCLEPRLGPHPGGRIAYERVEDCDDPHAMIDVEADNPALAQRATDALHKRVRITQADCRKYELTDGCACCEAIQENIRQNHLRHTKWCRIRMYGEWEQAMDPKWRQISRYLEKSYPSDDVAAGNIDLEGLVDGELPGNVHSIEVEPMIPPETPGRDRIHENEPTETPDRAQDDRMDKVMCNLPRKLTCWIRYGTQNQSTYSRLMLQLSRYDGGPYNKQQSFQTPCF